MTTAFYRDLPVIESFADAVDSASHHDLPDDWWVIVTDVVGSTAAIERGAYKLVNSLGVASIVAISNVDRSIEFPYVFGGDGSTCAVPGVMGERVRNALIGLKRIATDAFGLELRAGMIRAGELKSRDFWLKVGKTRLSKQLVQAALSGRGWEAAERMVKDEETRGRYEVMDEPGKETVADLSGYECRWQGVKPRKQYCVCILVQCMDQDGDRRVAMYREVIARMDGIFGDREKSRPVATDRLKLSLLPKKVWEETKLRAHGAPLVQWIGRFLRAYTEVIAGAVLMKLGLKAKGADWSTYRMEVSENTDYRKFDGTLKAVVEGMDAEVKTFRAYLDEHRVARRLVYGLHTSRSSLLTCMVQAYDGDHVHFVDGADGGYALAAKELKAQVRGLADAAAQAALATAR